MLPKAMPPKRPRPKKMTAAKTRGATRAAKPRPSNSPAASLPPPAPPPAADLAPDVPPTIGDIPWGYGDTRITAMARDPHWIFAYWEMTDEAIAAARGRLGRPDSGLALRVYDTTYRSFNGLNANGHWDVPIERATNSYYLRVDRPAATFHVDVGVLGGEGAFVPIARSGAVATPRDSVSPDPRTEWSTVLRAGPGYSYRHRFVPRSGNPAPGAEAGGTEGLESVFGLLAGEGWTSTEWIETLMDGRVVRWIRWAGPYLPERLRVAPGGSYRKLEVLFEGERRVVRFEEGERFVYGPWRIVIEAVGPRGERHRIDRWMIRRRWTTLEGSVRVETASILRRLLGGRRGVLLTAGSERRLAGEEWGSEFLQVGASEWGWIGASETLLQGGSESRQAGGSETLFLGATERIAGGGSEERWLGASEAGSAGASESVGGASEGGRP